VSRSLLREWVRLVAVPICQAFGVTVQSVAVCASKRKGYHVYVQITPPIHAELAWRLQFLLGDDSKRVSLNRARLRAGFSEWNKLFEGVRPRMTEVYAERNTAGGFAKETVVCLTRTSMRSRAV